MLVYMLLVTGANEGLENERGHASSFGNQYARAENNLAVSKLLRTTSNLVLECV